MEYLASIVRAQPLSIHFNLHNPSSTNRPVYIPRTLGPLGVFVTLEIRDTQDNVVYEGPTVRATHRLAPADPASYQQLEAGYTFGVVLEADDFEAPPGVYTIRLSYTNAPFVGTPTTPVGELAALAHLSVEISR